MKLSRILASSCRQRILKVLIYQKQTNIMKLVKDTNCAYNELTRNLKILEEEGIVTSNHVGRRHIINLNFDNTKTQTLLRALELLDPPAYSYNHCKDSDPDFEVLHLEEH